MPASKGENGHLEEMRTGRRELRRKRSMSGCLPVFPLRTAGIVAAAKMDAAAANKKYGRSVAGSLSRYTKKVSFGKRRYPVVWNDGGRETTAGKTGTRDAERRQKLPSCAV